MAKPDLPRDGKSDWERRGIKVSVTSGERNFHFQNSSTDDTFLASQEAKDA